MAVAADPLTPLRPDQTVAKRIHSVDNAKIIAALHKGTWPTVEGTLHWNAIGEPQGNDLLMEWLGGKLYPVLPANVATKKAIGNGMSMG